MRDQDFANLKFCMFKTILVLKQENTDFSCRLWKQKDFWLAELMHVHLSSYSMSLNVAGNIPFC